MSSYATLQNFKDWLGSNISPPGMYQIVTDRIARTTASDAVGQELLDLAEGEMHQYLGGRYAVPINVAGDAALAATLRGIALPIAEFMGFTSNPFLKPSISEALRRKYDEAIGKLKRIADGVVPLPGATEIPGSPNGGGKGYVVGHVAKYTENALRDL